MAFKQELFENCYKRISKRIAAAKKKAKANKDLKSVSKSGITKDSQLGTPMKVKKKDDASATGASKKASTVVATQPEPEAPKKEPILEPHHL